MYAHFLSEGDIQRNCGLGVAQDTRASIVRLLPHFLDYRSRPNNIESAQPGVNEPPMSQAKKGKQWRGLKYSCTAGEVCLIEGFLKGRMCLGLHDC